METVNNFLKKYPAPLPPDAVRAYNVTHRYPRPIMILKDGFKISVQAGAGLYSHPRLHVDDTSIYTAVELGYPNKEDDLLTEYAENENILAVYPYVPVEVVNELIKKHGGIDHDSMIMYDLIEL